MSIAPHASGAIIVGPAGAELVRDVTLGAWAGLRRPREIRRTIGRALKAGRLFEIGAATGLADLPASLPIVVRSVETYRTGRGLGRSATVTAFALNEIAAVVVVTALRTSRAEELARAVAAAFLDARRRAQATAPLLAAPAPAQSERAILAAVETLTTAASELAALASRVHDLLAALPGGGTAPPALPALPLPASTAPPAVEGAFPAAPAPWLSPSAIAARASTATGRRISRQLVGRTLALLGYHGASAAPLRRVVTVPRAHGAPGEVTTWRYSPEVTEAVVAFIAARGPKKAPDLASVRLGAQQVLRVLEPEAGAPR